MPQAPFPELGLARFVLNLSMGPYDYLPIAKGGERTVDGKMLPNKDLWYVFPPLCGALQCIVGAVI